MPRLKPIKRDEREIAVLAEIGGTMAAMRITQGEMARRANISPTTMSDQMKDIGSMRLRELWAIQDVRKRAGL